MIRPTIADDIDQLMAIATAIGFEPRELEVLSQLLIPYFRDGHDGDRLWFTDDNGGPVGVAYCEPERMTNGTWNLLFIAIHSDYQGQGRGSALIHHVEQTLIARGARLLLVETLASFERTRAFYVKRGYEEEASIRDFYDAGADKIVYRKLLVAS